MAKKDKLIKAAGDEHEKMASTEISLPDADPTPLTNRKTERKNELATNQKKRASIKKKADNAVKANSIALKASRTNLTKIDSSVRNSATKRVEEKVADNNNATISNGNSFKKRTSFIGALCLSYFLVLFLLLFCVVPLKEISYQVPVVYQDTETYTEQEPYIDTVYYSGKEPYTVTQAYVVSQPYTVTEPYMVYQPSPPQTPHHRPSTNNTTSPDPPIPPLPPQPTVSYREVTKYMDITQYRDVTQYQDVQRSRNEIKVRPVQKQRTVTKVKQETKYKMVPMLYYLISY